MTFMYDVTEKRSGSSRLGLTAAGEQCATIHDLRRCIAQGCVRLGHSQQLVCQET